MAYATAWRMRIRSGGLGALVGATLTLAIVVTSAPARAECGDGVLDVDIEECDVANTAAAEWCTEQCRVNCETNVGDSATDHTCQHVAFGPFGAVAGNGYPGVINSVISQTHVYFTVTMARNEADEVVTSAVNLFPIKSSSFALYLDDAEPVTLLDAQGEPVPVLLDAPVSTCAAGLARVLVFALDVNESYLLVFPAGSQLSRSLVVEELSEHARFYSLDEDGDGFGQSTSALLTWCKLADAPLVQDERDCDDTRAFVFPGAPELCDGLDNDCDGSPEPGGETCEVDMWVGAPDGGATSKVAPTEDAQAPTTTHLDAGALTGSEEEVAPDGGEPAMVQTTAAPPPVASSESMPRMNTTDAGRGAPEHERDAGIDAVSTTETVQAEGNGAGCGCTVVGERTRFEGLEALGSLLLLSCGLRRRITGSRRNGRGSLVRR